MRLWSLHPSLLDRMGLLALWREGLLAQKVLLGLPAGALYAQHQAVLDSTGWHHHEGPSWVILERANSVVETEACESSTPLQAGTAFAEPPNNVHKVDNFGPGEATIWWATVYPQGSTAIVPDDGPPSCQH
jgi:hypothetical protein